MKRKRSNVNNRNVKRVRLVRSVPSLPTEIVKNILTQARTMKIRNAIRKTKQNNPFMNYTTLASQVMYNLPMYINKRHVNDEIRRMRILNKI